MITVALYFKEINGDGSSSFLTSEPVTFSLSQNECASNPWTDL